MSKVKPTSGVSVSTGSSEARERHREDESRKSVTASPEPQKGASNSQKRKIIDDEAKELEIDVNAPEPLSKKASRKAKKQKLDTSANGSADGQPTSTTIAESPSDSKAQQETASKRSQYGIWIGNLPFVVDKSQLRDFLISKAASQINEKEITRIHIPGPTNATTSKTSLKPKNKGFAYVDFASQAALDAAILLSETSFGGRPVLIKDAKSFQGRPEKVEQNDVSANGSKRASQTSNVNQIKRIFVGNLGFDITKEDLQNHFVQCGTIAHVHMATFEDTGKCKGYAWITFDEADAAEAAVQGWTMKQPDNDAEIYEVPENKHADGGDEEDHGTGNGKSKKTPKPRKWFVNRLYGRALRCEFAEDSATRYKKRFGKQEKQADTGTGAEAITRYERGARKGPATSKKPARNGAIPDISPGAPTDRSKRRGKFGQTEAGAQEKKVSADVSYRSGALVASEGTKTTFDT